MEYNGRITITPKQVQGNCLVPGCNWFIEYLNDGDRRATWRMAESLSQHFSIAHSALRLKRRYEFARVTADAEQQTTTN